MDFLYVKAIHIVFIVSWFAALFYIVRLFIYATEAQLKEEPAKTILTTQLLFMQKKLWYIIGWPAMIGTFVFGWWMFFLNFSYYVTQPWMWLKLISVGLLTVYHLWCQVILNKQKQGIFNVTSFKLRLMNELATVFLVAIVFLVVVKSTGSLAWSLLGLLLFAAILMSLVALYRQMRLKQENKETKKDDTTPVS